MIPYAKQSISEKDIEAVVQVLRSDFITQGPVVNQFETAIAQYCQAQYAIAVSSGTAALHLACRALGIGQGDIVWTSPNTFVASANCVLYCGASIDFIDIDPHTYNISIAVLKQKLETARENDRLPAAIIPVHFAGQSCDMEAIYHLSQEYGFKIIEDAAHALGGEYNNHRIGSCRYSDITIFSLHPAKMITAGEGGLLLTNSSSLAEQAVLLRTHGITRDPSLMEGESHGLWYYQQTELGYNYRITDIQAALGLSQLQRLNEFVSRRSKIAERYNRLLSALPLNIPQQYKSCQSSWHLYVICLQLNKLNKNRKEIFDELRKKNIGVHVHYIPVHTQPFFKNIGFKEQDFPESVAYYQKAITLPIYVDLSDEIVDYIVGTLSEILV